MDNRNEIREFLRSRRAKISPQQAGVPIFGDKRRVPGLRRGEVADLAGVSVEYYTRLERGNLAGASEGVLDALASALQLDEAEREHLFHLARTAGGSPSAIRSHRKSGFKSVPPVVQRMLDAMTDAAGFVLNGRLDVVADNALCRAMYSPLHANPSNQGNLARFCFFDPHAITFFRDWNDAANTTVALLRAEAGRSPYDKELTDLIGELSTRSSEFRIRWAAHNVRRHRTGVKQLQHPTVGRLDLPYETMELITEPGLSLTVYSAEPGSSSEDGVRLLASWSADEGADEGTIIPQD